MRLYDFQKEQVKQLSEGFTKHRTQCLAWYTGAGKTNVFSALCKQIVADNPNVRIGISAFLTTEIRDQIRDRLGEFGLAPVTHMISGTSWPDNKNIYVFNPQGLFRKDLTFKFDYFIIDESHAGTAESCLMIRQIMSRTTHKDTRVLLVSATPWDTLAQEEYADVPVFKRPLDQGLKDGLITDFRFHAEEASVTYSPEDFNRQGDLGANAIQRSMAILKSACFGKMEYLLAQYDKEIGKKCLVICPPGNYAEIARELAKRVGGLHFTQSFIKSVGKLRELGISDSALNLAKFRDDPKQRFLFVVGKCQTGFDMTELNSVIDLTMSRNIKMLAQRCGRIARKNGAQEKHYFYVYDTSLMKDKLEWLVTTMIDFCLGAYDGWTTKTAKYRKTDRSFSGHQWIRRNPVSVQLREVIESLREHTQNVRTLSYVTNSGPPTKWTLERARAEAAQYPSRTEMWSQRPALYKWFRLNAKAEMDNIFPIKNRLGYWTEERVIAAMKSSPSRNCFAKKQKGAADWIRRNKRADLMAKHLPGKFYQLWTEERARAQLLKIKQWKEIRNSGLRNWMQHNKGERYWQRQWFKVTKRKVNAVGRKHKVK